MADVKTAYAASSNLTVTNLASLASSATWVSGWTSGTIDNSSDLHLDKIVSAKFTVGSSPTAGEIRVYVYTELDDSNWPDLFSSGTEGTEGAATIHDTEMRDSGLVLLWSSGIDTTTNDVYSMPQTSLRAALGFMPRKCAIYVAHSTVAALHSSGQQVTVKGIYETVA